MPVFPRIQKEKQGREESSRPDWITVWDLISKQTRPLNNAIFTLKINRIIFSPNHLDFAILNNKQMYTEFAKYYNTRVYLILSFHIYHKLFSFCQVGPHKILLWLNSQEKKNGRKERRREQQREKLSESSHPELYRVVKSNYFYL